VRRAIVRTVNKVYSEKVLIDVLLLKVGEEVINPVSSLETLSFLIMVKIG